MIIKLFLILGLGFAHGKILDNGFVGNGGEGILVDGQLYLRDLYGMDLHTTPHFKDIDVRQVSMTPPDLGFEYPRELLLQKLIELDQVAPGFGSILLEVINKHMWQLVNFELSPVSPARDPRLYPNQVSVVQIANRLKGSIRIHRASWNLLNPENKVALLIHEAVFSLVRLEFNVKGFWVQSDLTAREVTAQLFHPGFAQSPLASELRGFGDSLLSIENSLPTFGKRAVPAGIIVRVGRGEYWYQPKASTSEFSGKVDREMSFELTHQALALEHVRFTQDLEKFCATLLPSEPIWIHVTIQKQVTAVTKLPYRASAEGETQIALKATTQYYDVNFGKNYTVTDFSTADCVSHIEKGTLNLFTPSN